MLVEEYLVAVVSLPAGVFNPYSGVKTSILILDKSLAKKTDRIAFFKVENDGFDLGAQRRPIDKNDLPTAHTEIAEYLRCLRADEPLDDFQPMIGLMVEKEKIAANGEYNLSGERYRENGVRSSRFPIVPLGEVANVIAGQSPPGKSYNNAGIGTPFYQGKVEFGQMFIGEPIKWTTDARRFAEEDDILMSVRAPVGPVNLATQRICIGRGLAAIRPTKNRLLTSYVFYILRGLEAEIIGNTGAVFASINKGGIKKLQIPMPPLEVQKEIVAEIEGYQKVIDGARAVVDNYRPHITIDPDWPMVAIGTVCVINPNTVNPQDLYPDSYFNYIDISCVENGTGLFLGANRIASAEAPSRARRAVERDDVLVSTVRPNLRAFAILTEIPHRAVASTGFAVIQPKDDSLLSQFLIHMIRNEMSVAQMVRMMDKGSYPSINQANVESIRIPLPPLVVQKEIVAEIEAEQALMEANRELIERFEKKISAAIGRVWGEAEPDTAEA